VTSSAKLGRKLRSNDYCMLVMHCRGVCVTERHDAKHGMNRMDDQREGDSRNKETLPAVVNTEVDQHKGSSNSNCVCVCAGEETELRARGRHDPCVVPRAVPMVESMVAMVLADQLLQVRPEHGSSLNCCRDPRGRGGIAYWIMLDCCTTISVHYVVLCYVVLLHYMTLRWGGGGEGGVGMQCFVKCIPVPHSIIGSLMKHDQRLLLLLLPLCHCSALCSMRAVAAR